MLCGTQLLFLGGVFIYTLMCNIGRTNNYKGNFFLNEKERRWEGVRESNNKFNFKVFFRDMYIARVEVEI